VPPDLTHETTIALRAAQEAGAVALGLQGGVSERSKSDGTPVSDADLAANAVLCQQLALHFPGDAVLSEETTDDPARLRARRLWIVDPIDGTRDFLAGNAGWAVQVALAIHGELALGVLVIPGERVSIVGIPGAGGSVLTPAGAQPLALAAGGTSVLIGSGSKRNRESMTRVRAALPEFGSMNATSVGVKVWRMVRGEADLYVHARPIAEWDVAAPAAILLAAGGNATDLAGGGFRFNTPTGRCPGLVFSTRADHHELIERMRTGGVGLAP
jgi:3'-phosphoadenosine 5'-phosphosulfate (PAPS) 3'-phosphatase